MKGIPEMYSINDLAKVTNLPVTFVRRTVKSGLVPSVKSGKKSLVSLEEFCDYLRGKSDAE